MRHATRVGFSFGLTSGIITTLGLMVGLSASTNSINVVIGGILTIAVADAFSDALGIHISEESEKRHSAKSIWQSTFVTFIAKFFVAISFVIPVLLFPLTTAIAINVIYGLTVLGAFSYHIANKKKLKHWETMLEHLIIAMVVIILTNFFGVLIKATFA